MFVWFWKYHSSCFAYTLTLHDNFLAFFLITLSCDTLIMVSVNSNLSTVLPTQNGENALYYASKTGQSQVAELLINKGANVNEENKVCYNVI